MKLCRIVIRLWWQNLKCLCDVRLWYFQPKRKMARQWKVASTWMTWMTSQKLLHCTCTVETRAYTCLLSKHMCNLSSSPNNPLTLCQWSCMYTAEYSTDISKSGKKQTTKKTSHENNDFGVSLNQKCATLRVDATEYWLTITSRQTLLPRLMG